MQLQIGKPLKNFLSEPIKKKAVSSWADLIINYPSISEILFHSNDNSLGQSLLLALLENICLFGKENILKRILKYIKMDTTNYFSWKHWDTDTRADAEKLITLILEKMKEEARKDDFIYKLAFLYELKEEKGETIINKRNFEELLNIMTRYLVITYVIEQKDRLFKKKERQDDDFSNFLKDTNLMKLSEPLSSTVCTYLSKIFSINIHLINYSKEGINVKREHFSFKEAFILQDIPPEDIVYIFNHQNEKGFRVLYTGEFEKVLFMKANKLNLENFCKTFSYNLINFCEKAFQARMKVLSNMLEGIEIDSKLLEENCSDFIKSNLSALFNSSIENSKEINELINVKKVFLTSISENSSLLHHLNSIWERTERKDISETIKQKRNELVTLENQIKNLKQLVANADFNQGLQEKTVILSENSKENLKINENTKDLANKAKILYNKSSNIEDLLENNLLLFNTINEEKTMISSFERKPVQRKQSRLMVSEEIRRRKSCFTCSKIFIRDQDVKTLACGDEVCRVCCEHWITTRINKGLSDLSRLPCFNYRVCQKFLVLDEISDVLGENKMELALKEFLSRPRSTLKPIFLCSICGSDILDEKEIKTFDCNHKTCKECVSNWLEVKFKDGACEVSNVKCLFQDCNQSIGVLIVKDIIGEEKFLTWTERALWGNCIVCPYKDCKTPFLNEDEQIRKVLKCPLCTRNICSSCKDPAHEKGICPKLYSIIGQSLEADERINMCPRCFTPYFKDDNCEHVHCGACKIDFCFRCSCLRQPTLIHGNHYHRKECPFFFPVKDMKHEDNYNPEKCDNCKKHRRACQKPLSYKKFCLGFVSFELYDKYLAKNVRKIKNN